MYVYDANIVAATQRSGGDDASDQESGGNGRQLAPVLKRETSFAESSSVLFPLALKVIEKIFPKISFSPFSYRPLRTTTNVASL